MNHLLYFTSGTLAEYLGQSPTSLSELLECARASGFEPSCPEFYSEADALELVGHMSSEQYAAYLHEMDERTQCASVGALHESKALHLSRIHESTQCVCAIERHLAGCGDVQAS